MSGRLLRRRPGAAALVAAALGTSACTLSIWSTEEQCENDGDCAQRGGAFVGTTCASGSCVAPVSGGNGGGGGGVPVDPAWACLQSGGGRAGGAGNAGNAGNPGNAGTAGGGTVRVTFHGVRLDVAEPLVGASVRPCRKNDLECTLLGVAAQLTDGSGRTTFELPAGFDGYFEGTRADINPILLFPGPLGRDVELPAVGGVTEAEAELFASFVQSPGTAGGGPDGAAILSANDCLGSPAAGVSFEVNVQGEVAPFFLINGVPNTTSRETDADGRGGFLGLPEPAFLLFRALRVATGERVGEVSAFTRVDAFTYVLLGPSP
jgi:hypothetical protein